MKRTYRLFIETLAAVFAAGMIAFFAFMWIVTAKPFASADFSRAIAASLEMFANGANAYVSESVLAWDNAAHALVLSGHEIVLTGPDGRRIAHIGNVAARLGALDLLRGRLIPTGLQLQDVDLAFTRGKDGRIRLGDAQGDESASPASPREGDSESLRALLEEITHKKSVHAIEMLNVTVHMRDARAGTEETFFLPDFRLNHRDAATTAAAHLFVGTGVQEGKITLLYTHRADSGQHDLAVQFDKIDPDALAQTVAALADLKGIALPLSGHLSIVANAALDLTGAEASIQGGAGLLTLPDLWDAPRAVKRVEFAAHYDGATQRLDVPVASIDFGGPKLALHGVAAPLEPSAQTPLAKMGVTLGILLDRLPMDDFASVWPKVVVPNARTWIAEHMHKGVFQHGEMTIKGRFAWDKLDALSLDEGVGKVIARSGDIICLDGLPPVTGANADATLDLDHMDILISSGGIGDVRLQPFTVRISDFQKNVQMIQIPVKLAGPVPDILRLMDKPPLGYAKAIGLSPDLVEGSLEGTLSLRFPLLASLALSDIEVKADAALKDFAASKLIPGLALSDGAMALQVDKEGYALKGPLRLNGAPLQISWHGAFGTESAGKPRNQATLNGILDGAQLKALGLDLSTYLKSGTLGLNARFSQDDKKRIQLAGDVDLKTAALTLGTLNWTKDIGVPGSVAFALNLQNGKKAYLKLTNVEAPGLKTRGTATLDPDRFSLLSLDLQPLIVGRTHAALHMTPSLSPGGAPRVTLEGESLDISGTNETPSEPAKASAAKPPRDYTLTFDRVYTSPTGFLTGLSCHAVRDSFGWVLVNLRAQAQGTQPVVIDLGDQGTGRVFSMETDDFGTMLKGFGLTDAIKGGKVKIEGHTVPDDPHIISGKIKIAHFEVADLPVLARLVSAVSPFGFADLITGSTSFSSLRGNFAWQGDRLDLQQVRMVGSAYGLNIGGRLDLDSGVANLHGTLVPFSFINSILNAIPMLGNVITGGDGQGILAAAYSVKGTLDDPEISVNPVSLLTPGFIRNLFFGDEDEKAKETPQN